MLHDFCLTLPVRERRQKGIKTFLIYHFSMVLLWVLVVSSGLLRLEVPCPWQWAVARVACCVYWAIAGLFLNLVSKQEIKIYNLYK